jgi:uncharacterized membrane protein YraQ (UPF0718 family)
MKNFDAAAIRKYGFFLFFTFFILISWILPFPTGIKIGKNFLMFFREMIMFLPMMFILIGLFDVWVPRERIIRHVGPGSGPWGILWVVLLAMLQAGPLYAAFPVAAILWKKGCSVRNVFIYLGAFSSLKIPMLAFEIGFMGLKFSLLRTLFSLPVFITIGYLIAAYLKNKNYSIKEPC